MNEVNYDNKKFVLIERDFQSLNSKNFGEKVGKDFLLNEFEVLYLIEKGKVTVTSKGKELSFNSIVKSEKVNMDIYNVYRDLKIKGYKVKSGTKYGFDFRVYDKKDKHAYALVLVIKDTEKMKISEIAGKCRISHSTRKKAIFAIVDKDFDITYYEHNWIRM